MKQKKFLLKIVILAITMLCAVSQASAEKHYVPGMGTYGVSTKKVTCKRCGKTYMQGDGHWCERPDPTPRHKSTSTSSSAEDRAARAAIDNDPTLLSNQCSFDWTFDPNAGNDGSEGQSEASKLLSQYRNGDITLEKESHTGRNILIGLAALAVGWWFFRRKK